MSLLPIEENNALMDMADMLPMEGSFGPLDEVDVTAGDLAEHMAMLQMIQQATDQVEGVVPPVDMLPNTYDDALMHLIDAVPLE